MKRYHGFARVVGFILVSMVISGCGARQTEGPAKTHESTCVQGTVWYRSPSDSTLLRYPQAKITAWRQRTDNPLGEAHADRSGNYCIEVPAGGFRMDLRVWGLQRLGKINYACQGSVEGIESGTDAMRCGEGCPKTDIVVECREFIPGQRRFDY